MAYYGWVHTGDAFRPFEQYREISRGARKGDFEVILPDGKKIITTPKQIKRFPGGTQDVPAAMVGGTK